MDDAAVAQLLVDIAFADRYDTHVHVFCIISVLKKLDNDEISREFIRLTLRREWFVDLTYIQLKRPLGFEDLMVFTEQYKVSNAPHCPAAIYARLFDRAAIRRLVLLDDADPSIGWCRSEMALYYKQMLIKDGEWEGDPEAETIEAAAGGRF